VYSKELIELLFEQPYCKVKFLVDKTSPNAKPQQNIYRVGENRHPKIAKDRGGEFIFERKII